MDLTYLLYLVEHEGPCEYPVPIFSTVMIKYAHYIYIKYVVDFYATFETPTIKEF